MLITSKGEFDNLIDRIKDLVLDYESNVLHNNQYQFFLANEKLSFEVPPQSVPHLLGIRLDYLRSTGLFKNQNAYELLKEFLENSYSVYRYVQEGHLSYNSIFSNQIEIKLNAFEKNIYFFSPNDIEFVCKYDKSKTFQLGLEKDYPCDYFLVKKDNTGNLYLLGLKKNANNFMPMSNLFIENSENIVASLKGLLLNQTITLVNSVLITNPITEFKNTAHLPFVLKLEKIKTLRNYAGHIKGVSIDTSSDYQFIVNGYLMKENKINSYKMLCKYFVEKILEHDVFDVGQAQDLDENTDNEMLELIKTYNNEISKVENSKAQEMYSDLLKEARLLASEVALLNQQLEEKKQETKRYLEQLQKLEQENREYKNFQEEIFHIVDQQRQL